MRSITIDGQKYFFLKLRWVDIAGLSTLEGDTEFNKLKCANIITEAYLYDVFEEDGKEIDPESKHGTFVAWKDGVPA